MSPSTSEGAVVRIAWLAAVAVAALGAGVLVGMWQLLKWPVGQHTWPDFRSGSLGDAVLLPTIMATLIMLGRRRESFRAGRMPAVVGGLLAAVTAGGVQYSWWADPTPPNSWTMSQPHLFSPAGAWHAGFFIVMAGLLGTLAIDMLVIWRELRLVDSPGLKHRLNSRALVLLAYAFLAFSGLVALDSSPTATSASSTSSLTSLGCAVLVIVMGFGWAARKELRSAGARLAVATTAAGITVVVLRRWPPSPWVWGELTLIVLLLIAADRALRRRRESQ